MSFRITRHSSASSPDDALDLLSERLGKRREEVYFSRVGREIRATLHEDDVPVAVTRDERTDIGRRVVMRIVSEACELGPELKFDWYAVGPA